MSPQRGAAVAAPPYARLVAMRLVRLVAAMFLLAAAIVGDVLTGPAMLDLGAVIAALFAPEDAPPMIATIVWSIRLPMALMAVLVGASLGVAGVAMQTILGNPLASPYTLGISAAAGFGAATAILTGVSLPFAGWLTVPLAAFAASALGSSLVYGVAGMRGMTSEAMVLAGIATLFLFQSLQSLVQFMAAPEVLQAIVFWLFGSLLKASWFSIAVVAAVLAVCGAALAADSWRLTALRLGDERAAAIGVDVKRLRLKVMALIALLTAAAVSFVGTIGFIGLVAPHLARMLVGEDQRILMPMAAIMGALVLSGASILSKLISPGTILPIGIVTAVIGVPFLLALIVMRRRTVW
jgi:iron complex transport system permease protein